MILQALNEYYLRRQANPAPSQRLPSFGLELKEIGFILELAQDGALLSITDTRLQVGKRLTGRAYLVPMAVKKTSGIAANLLWDTAPYALGLPSPDKLDEAGSSPARQAEYAQRVVLMHAEFTRRIESLPQGLRADAGIQAVIRFLRAWPQLAERHRAMANAMAASGANLSFRLDGDEGLVCQRAGTLPMLAALAAGGTGGASDDDGPAQAPTGPCLITGSHGPVARLHTAIKGVWGAQTSGANIVSFNLEAFNSYGFERGANAPVGAAAAFAYTTALNALLARDSRQRMQVADASTVFWAQKEDPMEGALAQLLGDADNPDAHTEQVRALLEAVHTGSFGGERGENRFYVLGLAPNAARIAVRFWHSAPLAEVAARVAQWFEDLRMVRGKHDAEFPALYRLLSAVAVQGKHENVPPRLGGDIAQSIFAGTPYPQAWLAAAVQRCHAERQVNYLRACAIKACLNRAASGHSGPSSNPHPREITAMLNPEHPSPGYRLGRLFATLEKIQEEANPGLNATIRERYYGAASTTPVAVFTTLLRLKNHHLAKLNPGRAVNMEKTLTQIMGGITTFPGHLALQEQGLFAVGYYHQRQAFFAPASLDSNNTPEGGV